MVVVITREKDTFLNVCLGGLFEVSSFIISYIQTGYNFSLCCSRRYIVRGRRIWFLGMCVNMKIYILFLCEESLQKIYIILGYQDKFIDLFHSV